MEQRRLELLSQISRALPSVKCLVLEIGCGHGHFLTAYAVAHPDAVCVGLDIESERIARATRKRDCAKLPNLHFIHADARMFLHALAPAVTLSEIYLLFPDPWPKQRHHKHRIIQTEFLDQLAKRAGQGARLFFRTDYRPYFTEAQATLRHHAKWQLVAEPWPFEHETVFQKRAAEYQSLVARIRSP